MLVKKKIGLGFFNFIVLTGFIGVADVHASHINSSQGKETLELSLG